MLLFSKIASVLVVVCHLLSELHFNESKQREKKKISHAPQELFSVFVLPLKTRMT